MLGAEKTPLQCDRKDVSQGDQARQERRKPRRSRENNHSLNNRVAQGHCGRLDRSSKETKPKHFMINMQNNPRATKTFLRRHRQLVGIHLGGRAGHSDVFSSLRRHSLVPHSCIVHAVYYLETFPLGDGRVYMILDVYPAPTLHNPIHAGLPSSKCGPSFRVRKQSDS
jgi:hypothetical protein